MCAFQMLSIDLFVVMVVLFIISLTEIIPFEYELTIILSVVFFFVGCCLVSSTFVVKEQKKGIFPFATVDNLVCMFTFTLLGSIMPNKKFKSDFVTRHFFCKKNAKKRKKTAMLLRSLTWR